ncbi:MAG: DUF2934 domain-containing protein [Phycisphaeraceae bacterium]
MGKSSKTARRATKSAAKPTPATPTTPPATPTTPAASAAAATAKAKAKSKAAGHSAATPAAPVTREQIAQRAYEIWLSKGRPTGLDQQNWHEAEMELHRVRR